MSRFPTLLLLASFLGLWVTVSAQEEPKPKPPAPPKLETVNQKAGYALGFSIGKDYRSRLSMYEKHVDPAALGAGFRDGFFDDPQMDAEARDEAVFALQEEVVKALPGLQQRERGMQRIAKARERAKKRRALQAKGEAFLTANKAKEGVETTESGLQFRVLKAGTGKQPTIQDAVVVHYTGKLADGRVFDSSLRRGKPATFKVTGVVKGWTEALQLMKVGAKWEIALPPELAYGARGMTRPVRLPNGRTGRQQDIPPHAVLVFEVELLAVTSGAAVRPPVRRPPPPRRR